MEVTGILRNDISVIELVEFTQSNIPFENLTIFLSDLNDVILLERRLRINDCVYPKSWYDEDTIKKDYLPDEYEKMVNKGTFGRSNDDSTFHCIGFLKRYRPSNQFPFRIEFQDGSYLHSATFVPVDISWKEIDTFAPKK